MPNTDLSLTRLARRMMYLSGLLLSLFMVGFVTGFLYTGEYLDQVEQTKRWAERVSQFRELTQLATQGRPSTTTTEPSHQLHRELMELQHAYRHFVTASDSARRDLIRETSPTERQLLLKLLEAGQREMNLYSASAEAMLETWDREKPKNLHSDIMQMNQHLFNALGYLDSLVRETERKRDIQTAVDRNIGSLLQRLQALMAVAAVLTGVGFVVLSYIFSKRIAAIELTRNIALDTAIASETRSRALIDHTLDGVITIDEDGRIESFNPAAEKLFGYTAGEVLGQNVRLLMPNPDARLHDQYIQRYIVSQRPRVIGLGRETMGKRKNGSIFPLHLAISELRIGDRRLFLGTVRDISETREYLEQLTRAKEEAEAATRSKSRFLATMSHEIRTPMNGILGLTELLADTQLTAEQRQYVETVNNSAKALLKIINDVLDLSKMEAGQFTLDEAPFALDALIDEVARLFSGLSASKHIEIIVDIDPACPTEVIGDAGRLRQIIMNLVSNAVKFTHSGYVKITAHEIHDRGPASTIKIAVEDSGIGICREDQQRLFEPFSQAERYGNKNNGGTGLGLYICRQLVQLMGGEIGVTSTPEEGSTFWFSVNLTRTSLSEQAGASPSQHVRVLLAESDHTTRFILTAAARNQKIHVTSVTSCSELQELLAKMQHQYEFIIIDEMFSDINLLELHERYGTTPPPYWIVIAGQATSSDDALFYRKRGFAGFLSKPVEPRAFLETLTRIHRGNATPMTTELAAQVPSGPLPAATSHSAEPLCGKVLLAEDIAVNQLVARSMLAKLGLFCDLADNGVQAVEMWRQERYDLVLMDCQMPVMDGYQAANRIRQLERNSGRYTPIVALTANAFESDRKRCLGSGMDDFIAKPIALSELQQVLARWLGTQPPRTTAPPEEEETETTPQHD